jgi:hypothetical protein
MQTWMASICELAISPIFSDIIAQKSKSKNPEPETLRTANDLTMFLLRSPQETPGNNDPTTGQQEQ